MFDLTYIFALTSFYFVMYATPGPNNAMILSSGIQFGFFKTLPHMVGITFGHVLQLILVCLGLGNIFANFPLVQSFLRILCAAYLCFLGYKLIGSLAITNKKTSRPLKFYEGAIFQLVNPKAWTISTMAASSFLNDATSLLFSIILISCTALIVCPLAMAPWPAFGATIKIFVKRKITKTYIEYCLMALLLITAILIVSS